MLKPFITSFLQHLCKQNNWSSQYLVSHSGKVVAVDVGKFKGQLTILEDGSLSIAGETAKPDATIFLTPSLLMRLIAKDESAKKDIHIEGNIHLVTELVKVLQFIRWDFEEDLSHVIGDVAANKTIIAASNTLKSLKNKTNSLAEMLVEYWQEENPLLAKKRHVSQFISEVDTLRNDVERAEKRLQKLLSQNKEII